MNNRTDNHLTAPVNLEEEYAKFNEVKKNG